jgi:2-polyprenylphenol 6-hydroxylase
MNYSADVVILGAGLVGSALASALKSCPVSVILIDHQGDFPTYTDANADPRVVAISPASETFLSQLGAWQNLNPARLCAYQGMEVWDGEGYGHIEFSAAEVHRNHLGHIIENSHLLSALRHTFNPQTELRTPLSLSAWEQRDGHNYLLLSDGASLTTPLVIGADGAQSRLREIAAIPTKTQVYQHTAPQHTAIVTRIRCAKRHGFIARQRFSQHGPLAFLPLQLRLDDPGEYCSIVWSLDEPIAEQIMQLNDQDFCARLTQASEACLGEVLWAEPRQAFPLIQRHAQSYGLPGLALVGDAAHSIHPLAGQGVNLGFYDVKTLAEEIQRAQQRQIPLNHPSIVQRYQRQRQWHNLSTMTIMDGFKRLFGSTSPLALVARNRGLDWVNAQAPLKRLIVQAATGEMGFK